MTSEAIDIGQGWRDMEGAPRDGQSVWLTDGRSVYRAVWSEDVHGLKGWRDDTSFSHFRTFIPLGWQPYFRPEAPGWPLERVDGRTQEEAMAAFHASLRPEALPHG